MISAAEVISKEKEKILELWEETVRKEIPDAEKTERLLLLNIMPVILDAIALILERSDGESDMDTRNRYEEIIEKSQSHGRHRATIAHFSGMKIVHEHMVLHRVLIRTLKSSNAYNEGVGIRLSFIIETSMSHSVNSFSDSLQKMREKLTGTLAHDIRNPLTTAKLGISNLNYEDGEAHFNRIKEMVNRSLSKSIQLVEDLLDSITVKAGEGISLEFAEDDFLDSVKLVVWEASEEYYNQFILKCEEEKIMGIFDSTAVRRVLENLLTNAVKYGVPDKPITIKIENNPEEVILKVHNYGEPIAPEEREDIFNFLKHRDKGSSGQLKSWGIGLSFVKMAAEAHGGRVEIESNEENGTTFKVVFLKWDNKPGKRRVVLNYEGK